MPLLDILYDAQRAKKIEILPFFYSAQFLNTTLAIASQVTQNVSIQSDSHFVVRYLNITTYDSPGIIVSTILAPLLLNLFDTGSGRTLMDSAQPIQSLMGGASNANGGSGGALPFVLPEPWLIRASGVAQITLANISTTRSIVRADVSLIGMKIYKYGTNQPPPMGGGAGNANSFL